MPPGETAPATPPPPGHATLESIKAKLPSCTSTMMRFPALSNRTPSKRVHSQCERWQCCQHRACKGAERRQLDQTHRRGKQARHPDRSLKERGGSDVRAVVKEGGARKNVHMPVAFENLPTQLSYHSSISQKPALSHKPHFLVMTPVRCKKKSRRIGKFCRGRT